MPVSCSCRLGLFLLWVAGSTCTKALASCERALDVPREQRIVKLIGDSQCEKYDFINDLAWYTSQKVSAPSGSPMLRLRLTARSVWQLSQEGQLVHFDFDCTGELGRPQRSAPDCAA